MGSSRAAVLANLIDVLGIPCPFFDQLKIVRLRAVTAIICFQTGPRSSLCAPFPDTGQDRDSDKLSGVLTKRAQRLVSEFIMRFPGK